MAISGRQLRFRRGFLMIWPGTARLPRPLRGLAMTNREPLPLYHQPVPVGSGAPGAACRSPTMACAINVGTRKAATAKRRSLSAATVKPGTFPLSIFRFHLPAFPNIRRMGVSPAAACTKKPSWGADGYAKMAELPFWQPRCCWPPRRPCVPPGWTLPALRHPDGCRNGHGAL